jgi:excisionase family DNA binding protein
MSGELVQDYIRVKTVADMLDVSETTVRRLIAAGRLRVVSLSGVCCQRVTRESLEEFLFHQTANFAKNTTTK